MTRINIRETILPLVVMAMLDFFTKELFDKKSSFILMNLSKLMMPAFLIVIISFFRFNDSPLKTPTPIY